MGNHEAESGGSGIVQRVFIGLAQPQRRIDDTASCGSDFFVAASCNPHSEFLFPCSGKHNMGMGIDKTGHDPRTVQVDPFCRVVFRQGFHASHRHNTAMQHFHPCVVDEGNILHFLPPNQRLG